METEELKFNLELTEKEGDIIANVMDAAIRAEGLKAAVVILPLFHRLNNALAAAKGGGDKRPGQSILEQ